MKIIKATETYEKNPGEVACFLAGACTNNEWREKVYEELEKYNPGSLVIYDPFNPNIENVEEQVAWEFTYLNKYVDDFFIFSVYFDKYTSQPISWYELGRASVLCKAKSLNIVQNDKQTSHFYQIGFPVIVSVHSQCKRKQDLFAQCKLLEINVQERTIEEHAKEIYKMYKVLRGQ